MQDKIILRELNIHTDAGKYLLVVSLNKRVANIWGLGSSFRERIVATCCCKRKNSKTTHLFFFDVQFLGSRTQM